MARLMTAIAAMVMVTALWTPSASAQATPSPATAQSFPEIYRVNFMAACAASGSARDVELCRCALRGLEFSWPFYVAQDYDAAAAVPEAQRTPEQLDLMRSAGRVIRVCVSNPNAYY